MKDERLSWLAMSSTGRRRDHFRLLATSLALCVVVALSGCGSSSSSHSTSAASGAPAASATTGAKSAVKSGKSSSTTTSAAAAKPKAGHSAAPAGSNRQKLAQAVKKFRADPVGAAFSVAAGIFKRFVYRPVVANPGGSALQRRFARLRASAALVFVGHSLSAASQRSRGSASLSSLSPRFSGLSNQALAMRSAFTKGQRPTAAIQSFMQSLRSTASTLQQHGVQLFLPASF